LWINKTEKRNSTERQLEKGSVDGIRSIVRQWSTIIVCIYADDFLFLDGTDLWSSCFSREGKENPALLHFGRNDKL